MMKIFFFSFFFWRDVPLSQKKKKKIIIIFTKKKKRFSRSLRTKIESVDVDLFFLVRLDVCDVIIYSHLTHPQRYLLTDVYF